MKCVNVPLQISRGNFVCEQIIQMHTIRKSNFTIIKLPSNGNIKVKFFFFLIQFTEVIKHN